jgi:hypothetical protein
MHIWPVYVATSVPESVQAIELLATFLKAGDRLVTQSRR